MEQDIWRTGLTSALAVIINQQTKSENYTSLLQEWLGPTDPSQAKDAPNPVIAQLVEVFGDFYGAMSFLDDDDATVVDERGFTM